MITPSTLNELVDTVWPVAELLGLSCDHIHFELVDGEDIQALASYQGLPIRYAHWSFGKSFGRLKTAYDYRLSHIYELVINSRPYFAFIDRSSTPAQAMLIVAHVMAHVDFFGHSRLFAPTNRLILHQTARHARYLAAMRQEYGTERVESLIDAGLVLADFLGPVNASPIVGTDPADVIGFVARYSPVLQDWEREVLLMLRAEAQYFWPQQISKISNEGYATFWHTRILRHLALTGDRLWDVAALNAKLLEVHPPTLNPYVLGSLLYQAIYREQGLAGVFQARDFWDDVGLIRGALTPEIAQTAQLGVYREKDAGNAAVAADVEKIRQQLIQDVEHGGVPYIHVMEDITKSTGELSLWHNDDGRELDFYQLPFALAQIAQRLWGAAVQIRTIRQGAPHVARHNGTQWTDEAV